ncbi:hypothetical protein RF11_15378 [Thelohanellus kitauei]|uniref:Uncharacterized protein n=1 Tax=Thelohanellus kitauei TaxID=669202 RepID=A0A0C2MEU1_THEKT|nr:hypothetical protein RF11_15378 [Thelohanellus kitauei]
MDQKCKYSEKNSLDGVGKRKTAVLTSLDIFSDFCLIYQTFVIFSRNRIKNRKYSNGEKKITKEERIKINAFMEVRLANQEISKRMGGSLHVINTFFSNLVQASK